MKKKKKNKKGKQTKCNICVQVYGSQNLDKHMHSYGHHEAMERLTGGEQMHKCWACEVCVLGMEQFSKHIETHEHKNKLNSLKQRREKGFTLEYNHDELKALCARRDHNRSLLKQQKKKDKLKKLREKKAEKFQKAFNQKSQMKGKDWSTLGKGFGPAGSHGTRSKWRDDRRVASPLNNGNKQGKMDAYPVLESRNDDGAQTVGPNGFCSQTKCSKSITWSMKEDVDFTSEAQPEIVSSWKENESQQSQCTSREQDNVVLAQKRSCDSHTSDFPPAKKHCLRDVPSMKPRSAPSVCGEKVESECVSQSAAPLRAPGLVQSNTDLLSVTPKNIRKSVDEERVPVGSSKDPDPELRPVTGKGLKQNEHGKERTISDVPHSSEKLSIKSQKHEVCKIKRKSSVHKQVNSLLASSPDPHGKPEPTQTRNVLPTLLSRSVSKTEANKPNLKVARGIRTSQKPSQAAESRVLKPALQKLISSKSSQWRVNWKEIYQEATHRKLQREKGMPRFGIELVTPLPPDPQGLVAEDVRHFELDEGFQWASIECDPVTLPCSVDPSSKDVCRFQPTEVYPTEREDRGKTVETTNHTKWPEEQKRRDVGENHSTSGMNRFSEVGTDWLENCDINDDNMSETTALGRRQNVTPPDRSTEPRQDKADHNRIQSIPVTQIKQEKQDFPNTDSLKKNPPKSQVNELLVMSLREDELCRSLEDVDSQLLRAQTALQTAFMEVQRLQMIKQQVTAEMSSLRSKRIDILQRIKNSRPHQTSNADSPKSAVQTRRRAAGASRQHQDTAPDRSSILWEIPDDQRRTDLSLALLPVSE